MNSVNKITQFLSLIEDLCSIPVLFLWSTFSLTLFLMVSRLAKQAVLPKTVLDVVVNVGQFAVASAKLFHEARVHSFEPIPDLEESLKKNVSRLGSVSVYPMALGDQEGETLFHVKTHSGSSSILSLANSH